jgi:hypothetical protein
MDEYIDDEPEPEEMKTLAGGFYWNDIRLQPFSIMRQVWWHKLRRGLWPTGEVESRSEYLGGAIIMIYLCSLKESEIESVISKYGTLEIVMQAMKWGEKNVERGKQKDIIKLALEIFNEAHEEAFVVKPSDKSGGADVGKPKPGDGGES